MDKVFAFPRYKQHYQEIPREQDLYLVLSVPRKSYLIQQKVSSPLVLTENRSYRRCNQETQMMSPRRYVFTRLKIAWYMESHDELKSYGFTVHICIDGFSRQMLWLTLRKKRPN